MTAAGWHDFFFAGGILALVAVGLAISPYHRPPQTSSLRYRLVMNLAAVAVVMTIILLANLL